MTDDGIVRAGWPPALVYALQFGAVGIWTAYASIYFAELGVSLALIGVLAAVPALVAILASPAWGLLADRLGDMRLPYLAGAVIAALAGVWVALGPATDMLLAAVFVLSIGAAAMTPLLDARTMQRLEPRRERFGQVRAFGSGAFTVVALATAAFVAATGLGAMFIGYAGLVLGAGIAAVLFLGRPPAAVLLVGAGPLAAIGLLRDRSLLLFFTGSVFVWTAAVGTMTLFSLRIIELGGDSALAATGWAINALWEVPFMLGFARFARRFRVEHLIVIGAVLFVIRGVLWTLSPTPVLLIAFTVVGAAAFAFVLVGTAAFVAERAPDHLQATAQALFGATTFALGSIAGAVLAGQIAAVAGIPAIYPAGVVASAIGAVLIWLGIARRRGAEDAQVQEPLTTAA
ncbi:MAG TPA: MFS transporter [Candidatus Limnocylindrales bacterium]|nr:MFS transporter [Candidatus Limnocylindrales bacterium]